MAGRKKRNSRKNNSGGNGPLVKDYRYEDVKRKNNPPAKIAAEGTVPVMPKVEYLYSPRRPPVLRFDSDGDPDRLPELLEAARQRALNDDEVKMLAEALRDQEPWLEWAGKREVRKFQVDPVALHIHERVSAKAILKVAAREDVERSLFADPQQAYHEAVQFYKHDIDWTNRLILGDSLQVMSSLARREDLAGKVQMIYIDPPYGIKFKSNFQPEIGNRDVKDREQDITREPEMVKAYQDTWHLGIHSYLAYLRDRILVTKELLSESGSIFVQISDENLHIVRAILDEIYGRQNQIVTIIVKKKGNQKGGTLDPINDYLLWYARDRSLVKVRPLFTSKISADQIPSPYNRAQLSTGEIVTIDVDDPECIEHVIKDGGKIFTPDQLTSGGEFRTQVYDLQFEGKVFRPARNNSWKLNDKTMARVRDAERIVAGKDQARFKKYLADFGNTPLTNLWDDLGGAPNKVYVVETNRRVLQRCILATTDPGDLVLDPTCGSGTTAYVAEQWGRRWITIDTSRVAVAIARQRLLTAKFDHYQIRPLTTEDQARNPNGAWLSDPTGQIKGPVTFKCDTVPHVTLKGIAQNTNLDPIFATHEPTLAEKLAACNLALGGVSSETRAKLSRKLLEKQKSEGRKAITDADRRRWEIPAKGTNWEHWQVPFDTDTDYPKELSDAITEYRKSWRAKMDEVNACIAANTEQEELVDKPEIVKGVLRVSGPFTVEAVQPPEMTLGDVELVDLGEGKFGGGPEELEDTFAVREIESRADLEAKNIEAYLEQMIRLLRIDGVRFPDNKEMNFTRLESLKTVEPGLHAEGRWTPAGQSDSDPEGKAMVCVAFGPQYGPVTAKMVEEVIRSANRLGYDDLVIAGFSFDGAAQAVIEEARHPRLRIHAAHIRPDINPGMNGLLKEQPGNQLFTVFGQPRTTVNGQDGDGMYTVTMEGVDIYNPVENSITSTGANKVAGWFLDSDYDGRTFCITQAFFPDRSAWGKLSKALTGVIDPERFEALNGTVSLPFPAGKHKCVAVKVIDPRGNEVMQVHKL